MSCIWFRSRPRWLVVQHSAHSKAKTKQVSWDQNSFSRRQKDSCIVWYLLYMRISGFQRAEGGIRISDTLPYSDSFHRRFASAHSWTRRNNYILVASRRLTQGVFRQRGEIKTHSHAQKWKDIFFETKTIGLRKTLPSKLLSWYPWDKKELKSKLPPTESISIMTLIRGRVSWGPVIWLYKITTF